jgi:formyltetrahydrofolate deformylase
MISESPHAILLISCPDRRGLVARISDFVFKNNGNILHADEHIDDEVGLFLMRIEWDLAGFNVARDDVRAALQPLAEGLAFDWQLHFSDERPRAAIFVSKYDHCLQDLIYRCRAGELAADFSLVVSNHPDLRDLVESQGLEYLVFPVNAETKPAQEQAVRAELDRRKISLIVLARYMQILTEDFVLHYPNRIINIHHSFLPAFAGPRPYHQAYRRGVKLIGATSHYVTAELDGGPIISQDAVRISHRDSVQDLIRKGRDLERVVLARAVRAHLEHRVLVYSNLSLDFVLKTAVFD